MVLSVAENFACGCPVAPQPQDVGKLSAEYICIYMCMCVYVYIYVCMCVYVYMPSVKNSRIVIGGHLGPPLMQSCVVLACLFLVLVPYSRIPVSKRVSSLTGNPCATLGRPRCLQGF